MPLQAQTIDEKRRSTTGYFVKLNGAAITSYSKLQEFSVDGEPLLPATSSGQAEFYALRELVKEITFLRGVMKFLGFPQTKPTPVFIDSQCAIDTTKRGHPNYSRNKHYDVSAWYNFEAERLGIISLHFIPGSENPSDMLTKIMSVNDRIANFFLSERWVFTTQKSLPFSHTSFSEGGCWRDLVRVP